MSPVQRIVLVDPDADLCRTLKAEIESRLPTLEVLTFGSAKEARAEIKATGLSCVLNVDGLRDLIAEIEAEAGTETETETDWRAVHAPALVAFTPTSRSGGTNRPKALDIQNASAAGKETEAGTGTKPDAVTGGFCGLVGKDPSMQRLYDALGNLGQLQIRTSVLIQGESGTGKELVARAIHRLGPRPDEPFMGLNCGAFNTNLLEDQLFGHVRGAFTGASSDRDGIFVAARKGTLFLDEVTEMGPEIQVKLLRAIQEREISPLGSDRSLSWEARLVVATNRDIEEEVASGRFRRDLFHRINVIRLDIPPLRERLADVPALATFFLDHLSRETGRRKTVSQEALELLCTYDYPGNVRELRNALEYAHALGAPGRIRARDLPREIQGAEQSGFKSLASMEREHILRALIRAGGKKVQAAKFLSIDRNRLYRLMRKHQIEPGEVQLG